VQGHDAAERAFHYGLQRLTDIFLDIWWRMSRTVCTRASGIADSEVLVF
jgi:hypothetical protein